MRLIIHRIVYADPNMYAGWPANHGAWQWGDEFLVGFMRGPWRRSSMHNIGQPFEKMQARSMDGGQTWQVERPNVDFEGRGAFVQAGKMNLGLLRPPPDLDLRHDSIRVCGVYDHGGDECDLRGAFYASRTHGRDWFGPFTFGLDLPAGTIFTGRTAVLDDLLFYSLGHEQMWGTDATFCARYQEGAFVRVGTVCEDDARAVMPAVAAVGTRMVCLLRRRKAGRREGWIDAFVSDDRGVTWSKTGMVGVTGGHNGNPAALLALPDGRLLAAYGDRDFGSMNIALSEDRGLTWERETLREGHEDHVDIGYPRLFLRGDGHAVCVYYWSDPSIPKQHIAATEMEL